MVRLLDYTLLFKLLEYDNWTKGASCAVVKDVHVTIHTLLFLLAGVKKGRIMECGASGAEQLSIRRQLW